MKDIKKDFKKIWFGSIGTSLLFIIIGILLIIKPAEILVFISTAIGIIIITAGIFSLLKYFKKNDSVDFFRLDLLYGVICLLSGGLLILNPEAVASFLPFVIGIWMIINSIIKIQYSLALKHANSNKSYWLSGLIMSIIMLQFGILFVFNPFRGATVLMQIIGSVIVFYAIVDVISSFVINKNIKIIFDCFDSSVKEKDRIIEAKYEDK